MACRIHLSGLALTLGHFWRLSSRRKLHGSIGEHAAVATLKLGVLLRRGRLWLKIDLIVGQGWMQALGEIILYAVFVLEGIFDILVFRVNRAADVL